ncbi:uncharacterized protein LOC134269541 [Saccostrea cucullata]|uniref:uncharacterized protein LOC134269541 n=1 Tax=Saccostrea cuccullata TaxID=36930 RepID=UPI002ED4D3E8
MNLEIFLTLALLCFTCGWPKGISSSKAVEVNQKTSVYPRRSSGRENIHRHDENSDENSDEKQSVSRESKEAEESDENDLKEDKALAVSADEKRGNEKDTVSMTTPNSPRISENTVTMPVSQEKDCPTHSGNDEICWNFEKEHCEFLSYVGVFSYGRSCESDDDCKESDPCQSGKCCHIPCDNLNNQMCRYPVDNAGNRYNIANSFYPEWNRDS